MGAAITRGLPVSRGWPLVGLMAALGSSAGGAINERHMNAVGHTLEHIHE